MHSPRPIVALPPPPLPIHVPLPMRPTDWQQLQSFLHLETVGARANCMLTPTECCYLLMLEDAATLRLSRPDSTWFGLRIPRATLWPLAANRTIQLQSHTRRGITVSWLSQSALRCMMQSAPRLRQFFVAQIALSNAYAETKLSLHLDKSANSRLADLLLELEADSTPDPIRCGHDALGVMLNLNRETVTALLNDFRRSGWVKLGYRMIRLVERGQLERVAAMF